MKVSKVSQAKGWIAALVLGIGMSVGVANAQDGADQGRHHGDRKEMMAKRAEHMKAELKLTEAQVAQIKAIRESRKAEFKADRAALKNAQSQAERQAAAAKLKADREAVKAQMKAVLTPEQQVKAKALRDARKEMRSERKDKRNERKEMRKERKNKKG